MATHGPFVIPLRHRLPSNRSPKRAGWWPSPRPLSLPSIDGFARTYLIDAQTNAITHDGSSTFAVNDEVAIVGVVRDGTAVATAVADKAVTNLNGPPMDAV